MRRWMPVAAMCIWNASSNEGITADGEELRRVAKKMINTMLHELPKETHAMCTFEYVLGECKDILKYTVVKFDGLEGRNT